MEIEKSTQVSLVHDLNSALFSLETVAKRLHSKPESDNDVISQDLVFLQDASIEKIKKALSLLMQLSK
jgi:hypothetical protein